MGKKKNVSERIPNGRTFQTRDEFFYQQGHYKKPGYENKGAYRKVTVVDTNQNDEMAVVKMTTAENAIPLPDYQAGKSRYKPFVLTKDDEGKPIKPGRKFVENKPAQDVPPRQVTAIRKNCFTNPRVAAINRARVRAMKGRKKK